MQYSYIYVLKQKIIIITIIIIIVVRNNNIIMLLLPWTCAAYVVEPHLFFRQPPDCGRQDNPSNVVLWKNPSPSSTRYYHPITFEFKKETIESTLEEVNTVVGSNSDFKNEIEFQVQSTLMFTIIDGKVSFTHFYYNSLLNK